MLAPTILLFEVSVKKSFKRLAVSRLVASHFVYCVVNSVKVKRSKTLSTKSLIKPYGKRVKKESTLYHLLDNFLTTFGQLSSKTVSTL